MGTRWRGMLAPLGVPTGDGRRFATEGVSWRELPMAQKWQRADNSGHDESVIVGSCERIEVGTVADAIAQDWISPEAVSGRLAEDTLGVWGFGELFDDVDPATTPRLAEDVAEAKLLLSKGVLGPSVDAGSADAIWVAPGTEEPLTDEEYERLYQESGGQEPQIELLFTQYEIAAATLVAIPAYAECRPFELLTDEPVGLTAAIRSDGWDELPLAGREDDWDGDAAAARLAAAAGLDGDDPDWDMYARGFLYRDDQADPETRGAYGFGIVDVIDGAMTIVPRAVYAVANVLSDGRGGTTIPEADQDAMRSVVERLYARMADEWDDPAVVAPWTAQTAAARRQLATTLTVTPRLDPALFADPGLDRLTPLTRLPDGRIVGHLASHDVCHVGIRHECVTAPVDPGDYSAFHRYPIDTTDGTLAVGRLTWGAGAHRCGCPQCRSANDDHACLGLSAVGAMSHHDQLTTIAWVRCGEDTLLNAIWISGIAADDVDDATLARLSTGQRISGDWRPIAGEHRLVEILALSRENPGYPLLPRVSVRSGTVAAITAAGMIHHPAPSATGPAALTDADVDRLAARVAADVVDRLVALTPESPPPDQPPARIDSELLDAATAARQALIDAYQADLRRVVG